jgi:dTDP-4-amino-4,6-dideoxygalactose transaminase
VIYISPPYASDEEKKALLRAADSGWIAPVGPQLDLWEAALSKWTNRYVVLLNSGTAAVHLALILAGVRPDDIVIVPTHTCNASVNPILYTGAEPYFVDSESGTWNMDPDLLSEAIEEIKASGRRIGAIIGVDIYGTPARWDRFREVADRFEIPLIQDSAEAMGANYQNRPVGVQGDFGVWSFNGNKIISTSGGGALICSTEDQAKSARKLATQAKDRADYYWHTQVGYTYRMSNLLAGFGHAQWENLKDRVHIRERHFNRYLEFFGSLQVPAFYSENDSGAANRWLSAFLLPGVDIVSLISFLANHQIEARRFWTPMHTQPIYKTYGAKLNGQTEALFQHGICLPCGAGISDAQMDRVIQALASFFSPSS